jgi:hypothetical protein
MTLLASPTTTADWMTAGGTVAAAGFALIATIVAIWQLSRIANQLTLAAQTNVSQAYAVVSERMAFLRDLLANDDAALYPYFYSGRDPLKKQPRSRRKPPRQDVLELACEAIVDFADVCVEQRKIIPHADMDWSTWDAYFRFLYQNSPVLKRFLKENKDLYPDYLTTVFGHIVVRDEDSGHVRSEWQVDESDEGLGGYPWMRTWLITELLDPTTNETEKRRKPKTLKAAVLRPVHASTIDVRFTWGGVDGEEQHEIESVLYSWVLSQLKSSKRWRTANIFVDGEDQDPRSAVLASISRWRRVWTFVVRLPARLYTALFGTRATGREPFLAPNVHISPR